MADSCPAVVLDKCFLQAAKSDRMRALAQSHRLLVSDALFYELLTAQEPARSRCFAKFPAVDNPVDLVSHVGTLMRLEIDTHKPAGKPSAHREQIPFRFNPTLLGKDYQLPWEALNAIEEHSADLRSDVLTLVGRANDIGSFFPGLLEGNDVRRAVARAEAESAIAEPGALNDFYDSLRAPEGEQPLPSSRIVNERWALYRWLQIQLLFALDLYLRYQGKVPQDFSPAVFERLEHDVLDAQVLVLGCLEGSFATREKKLIRWWKLLCPDGTLLES